LDSQHQKYLQDCIDMVTQFHGKYAPGAVIGVYMVDLAQRELGEIEGKLNAIAESIVCLADAIQIMTGCTIGNKYLWLMNFGRYALTLYDRTHKNGIRVFVDYDKIDEERTPTLKKFFDGTRTYEKIPRPEQQKMVTEEFLTVTSEILSFQKVMVQLPEKGPLPDPARCGLCTEWFKTYDGEVVCKACNQTPLYIPAPIE